ncbi:MAG: energy transducer TonB [Bacteroidales bacterium]|nr:energy transducer TonB [Bacteroidales bacterium]
MKGITEMLVLMLLFPFFAEAQKEDSCCINPEYATINCIEPTEIYEPVYNKVEKMPAYPGGMRELIKDIEENLVYPEDAKKDSIQGYVFVRFVVDKEGHITNPDILKFSPYYAFIDSPAFDSAALDVLSHLKTFIPGEQHGKKVNVYYFLPILFKLDK